MTCIGDEKREVFAVKAEPAIGPGTYNTQKQTPIKKSYAPFSSLQPKFASTRKETKNERSGIGPGSYEISKGIGEPSFTKIENEHSIIIKINDFGSSAFRSEIQRFGSAHSQTPGPDICTDPNSTDSRSRKRMSKSNEHPIIVSVKKMNEKYDKERQVKSLIQPRNFSENIGPGHYDPDTNQFKRDPQEIRGPRWELSKCERFKADLRQPQTEQHDKIMLDQIRRQHLKEGQHSSPSNFFKSDTVKSYFDQIYYQTQSSLKAEIRRKLGFKNPYPAPGSYLPVYKEPPVHSKYQFFGSTQQRFKEQNTTEVGPGDYLIPSGFARNQRKKHRLDKTKRYPIQNLNQTPGPGAYNSAEVHFKKPATNIQEFGCLDIRFKTTPNEVTETPFSEMLATFHEKLKCPDKIPVLNHSIFRSKTERDCFVSEKERKELPFGEYNVSQQDIGERLNKQRNYINNLEYCLLKRPAFDSSTNRFQQPRTVPAKVTEEEQTRSRSLEKAKKSQRVDFERDEKRSYSSVFKSKETRKVFDSKYTAPPVGSYDQLLLMKKCFNKRYQPKPANGAANRLIRKGVNLSN